MTNDRFWLFVYTRGGLLSSFESYEKYMNNTEKLFYLKHSLQNM